MCWAIRVVVISCHGPESRKKKLEAKKRKYLLRAVMKVGGKEEGASVLEK